jgi:hypothetical protein
MFLLKALRSQTIFHLLPNPLRSSFRRTPTQRTGPFLVSAISGRPPQKSPIPR